MENLSIEIPEKSIFKLDEVCSITGVKPYLIRFWESEFDQILPITSSTGQKLYQHSDLEMIAQIKDLVLIQGMSVHRARKKLSSKVSGATKELDAKSHQSQASVQAKSKDLVKIQQQLRALVDFTEQLKSRFQQH